MYFIGHIAQRKQHPTDDLISDADEGPRRQRPAVVGRPCARLAAAAADRRHRHHLERDRRRAVASGEDAGRPRAAGRRAGTDADRDRGIPARLCAGDDGARGDEGDHHRRLPDQARQHGAAVVPRRQPRPRGVSRCRQGRDRPQGESARRLRARHPPLRRLQSGADGDDGGDRGMAEADSRLPPRSDRAKVRWSEGTVRGPRQLPILFGTGRADRASAARSS